MRKYTAEILVQYACRVHCHSIMKCPNKEMKKIEKKTEAFSVLHEVAKEGYIRFKSGKSRGTCV